MKELKKELQNLRKLLSDNKLAIGVLLAIAAAYVFLRLVNILTLPLFTDEAIYIRWSQIARYDANWRFISLTDGKGPTFVWLTMVMMKFVTDPLLAGRLVSVGAGFLAMTGLFLLTRELFRNTWMGIVASFLYLLYPMSLVYDRLALYDSLVGAFTAWGLYLIVLLVRYLRFDVALLLGMVAGGGILTKSNALFTIYSLPFSLLLFPWKEKEWLVKVIRYIAFALLATGMAYAFYSLQRLSPFYHIINEKNHIFIHPLQDVLQHPLEYIVSNLRGLTDWFITYIGWPVFALMIASFFVNKSYLKEKVLLVFWFLLPFAGLTVFGNTIYPRFIFFMTLFLLPLAAYAMIHLCKLIKNKQIFTILFVAVSIPYIFTDYYILTDFAQAPIPQSDLGQYMNAWPAGGGLREVIAYLSEKAKTQKIFVASLGDFGSLPKYATEIYLGDNKNVERREPGIYPVPGEIPKDILEKAKIMPTYIFSSNQEEFDSQAARWPIEKVLEYRKGIGGAHTRLYVVHPQ